MANKVIPFSKIKKVDIINVQGGMTASDVMKKYKPDILMNLALYDVDSGTNITHLVDENKYSGYLFSNQGIGLKNNKPVWTNIEEAKKNNEIKDFVSGSPTLVINGKKNIDWGNKYSSYIDGTHKRSAFGFNDSHLILLSTDGNMSLNSLADTCVNNFGAKYMVNCDGGGSCHLQEGTKIFNKSTRKNVSWLLVYLVKDNETLIKVDGQNYPFESINKDGFTYVKLRDFEQAGYVIGYENGVPSITKP